jgi:hypothetical protein
MSQEEHANTDDIVRNYIYIGCVTTFGPSKKPQHCTSRQYHLKQHRHRSLNTQRIYLQKTVKQEYISFASKKKKLLSNARLKHTGKIIWRMKMAVLWVIAPCSMIELHRRFRGASCLHHQGYKS